MTRTSLALLGCLVAAPAMAATEINYWLWDPLQKPAYQECATAFEAKHPDVKVTITQTGWNDYWTALTAGFVSGTAPDVFTDHLSRYPEFASNGVLVDVGALLKKDNVKTDVYAAGLLTPWQRDGKTYGLPKDWDTIALVYNKQALEAAGVDPAELKKLTWNPKDGGTFEKVLARLTVDENGKRAGEPGFDKGRIKQYGILIGDITAYGQGSWSPFAVSNGFKYNDGPWATKYYYDDPKLAEAVQYLADLSLKKGIMAPAAETSRLGTRPLFVAGKGAVVIDGSWQISWYVEKAPFPVGFAPLPVGPKGRKSMFNGLADSIWSGSKHPAEAWAWAKFLGSPECQDIVGKHGVVFPAVVSSVSKAKDVYTQRKVDVAAFIEEARPESTFAYPITDHASQVSTIMQTAFDNIFLGKSDARSELARGNREVNALFQ